MTVEQIANELRPDSYVSGLWIINMEGLIPEGVLEVTSATRDFTGEIQNDHGRFTFSQVPMYWGFEETAYGRIATREKALLDFFWWKKVEWRENEFFRWRIQDPFRKIDHDRLHEYAVRWRDDRLIRATSALNIYLHTKT